MERPERTRIRSNPARAVLLLLTAFLFCVGTSNAQASADSSPQALVRATVKNEIAANSSGAKSMFRSRKQNAQGSQTRIFVETSQATAALTIAYNDKPLTPDQARGEQDRLNALASSPELLSRKRAQENENAQRSVAILKALPDAFIFESDGEVAATDTIGGVGRRLVRLKFHPNPNYQPPTHVEQVLIGMQGFLLIDPVQKRFAEIDGTLFKEVSFGWGILGHLNPGGHFLVDQRDTGNGSWEISRMSLAFNGKLMLFKTLAIHTEESFSDFRTVPSNTTFAKGIEMLKAEESKLAQNPSQSMTEAQRHR